MKNYADVLKLLDEGFTRDEILAMDDQEEGIGADEQNKGEAHATEQNKGEAHATEQSEKGAQDVLSKAVSSVLGEIKTVVEDFKKEITAMNIMNSQQKGGTSAPTGEEVLANIINPFNKKDK